MPLPVLEKTWQIQANNSFPYLGSNLATARSWIRPLKNAFLAPASNPWSVVGSSNGATGALDAVDRWTVDGDLIWAADGVAHSWIVLAQPQVSANFQVLLSLSPASAGGSNLRVSTTTTGFVGGSNTTNPTAVDEVVGIGTANGSTTTGGQGNVFHYWQSTDGQCTRVVVAGNNLTSAMLLLDRPQTPVTGWTNPYVNLWRSAVGLSNVLAVATLWAAAPAVARDAAGTGTMTMFMSAEGFNSLSGNQINQVNPFNLEWPFFPIGLASLTGGSIGRHGRLADIWIGSAGFANGDYFPDDGSRQFVALGSLVMPWDGSIIQLAA